MFELAPAAKQVVTIIGAVTALFAATVGLAQNDIKRVIAYSTCSQLGYMFFAAGVGAYQAAMFHLFTHAFFQGPAVPGRRLGDPRHAPRAGHAPDGRADALSAADLRRHDHRQHRHRRLRRAAGVRLRGLLLQGRILESAYAAGRGERDGHVRLRDRRAGGGADRLLLLPSGLHDLQRPGGLEAGGARRATT
jgi:hypothetical protein